MFVLLRIKRTKHPFVLTVCGVKKLYTVDRQIGMRHTVDLSVMGILIRMEGEAIEKR